MNVWRDITEIAFAFIGVATVALLVSRSRDTVDLIDAGVGGFDRLLRTVTLQNQYGNFAQQGRY